MLGGQLVDQGAGEGMEAGTGSMAFPSPLPAQQPAGDPSVVGPLPTEILATFHVTRLDGPDLRERQPDILSHPRGYSNSVERGFVGVQGDEREGNVRCRRSPSVDENGASKSDVHLGHAMVRVRQDPSVVLGDG